MWMPSKAFSILLISPSLLDNDGVGYADFRVASEMTWVLSLPSAIAQLSDRYLAGEMR